MKSEQPDRTCVGLAELSLIVAAFLLSGLWGAFVHGPFSLETLILALEGAAVVFLISSFLLGTIPKMRQVYEFFGAFLISVHICFLERKSFPEKNG